MDRNSNIGLALITGATLGAVFSILYAPARGSDTRQRIADSAESAADALIRAAEQLKDTAAQTISTEKDTLETRLNSIFSQSHHDGDELIALLEEKLDGLKKKGRSLNKKKVKK